jgi:putative sterol carrier protein
MAAEGNGAVEGEVGADALTQVGDADAEQLAAMVGQVDDEQLAEALADPENRTKILDEIFRRMADHVKPSAIAGKDAVVHFRITEKPGGGEDVYEVVIADGKVTLSDSPQTEEPKVAIVAAPLPFIKLVTGHEAGPTLFMSGKLKVEGDLMFATQMTSFFRIPGPS